MANNTTRYPEFKPEANFDQAFLVGYKNSDKRERRFSFEDFLLFQGFSDYSSEQIQGWLNAGFTWVDIGVFLLQRQNFKRDIAEPFLFARVPSYEVDNLLAYLKTAEGFVQTGIALCDGTPFVDGSGSAWNLKDRYIRAYAPDIKHDGQTMLPYQTLEDATQKITGFFGGPDADNAGLSNAHPHKSRPTAGGVFFESAKGTSQGLQSGGGQDSFVTYSFDNSLVARTSSETRPKTIYFPYFQVVKKLDWRTLNYKQPTALNP